MLSASLTSVVTAPVSTPSSPGSGLATVSSPATTSDTSHHHKGFLNVYCRSDPGSEFTQEARDCNTAVSSLLSPDLSHDLVLTSGYYGAPIAAQMLTQAPGRYSAVILKNPELDLTRALVEEPNIIRRTFLTQSDR